MRRLLRNLHLLLNIRLLNLPNRYFPRNDRRLREKYLINIKSQPAHPTNTPTPNQKPANPASTARFARPASPPPAFPATTRSI